MFVVLTFAAGPERGECLAVSRGDRLTLGRSSKAGRKIRDSHLSRIHFEIDFGGDTAKVRDLESRNGTCGRPRERGSGDGRPADTD